jgi:hypothetical protein
MSLLDKASLIVTPNAYKASKLYSVVPSTGAGDMDVVRATTATRVNSLGLIESVAVNVPRIDYTNGSCPSLLVEPQRTNLDTTSQTFLDWILNNSGGVTTSTVTTSNPYTFSTVQKVIPSATFGQHRPILSANYSAAGRFWVVVKADGYNFLSLADGGGLSGANIIFNLSNGTISGSEIGYTPSITSLGNGWYICSINILFISNTGRWIIIRNNNTTADYSGNGTSGILFAHKQMEVGSYDTSSILTNGTAVTRNADVISKTGISSLIGQTEGTMFLDYNLTNFSNQEVFINSVYTNSIALGFLTDGTFKFRCLIFSNSIVTTLSSATISTLGNYKIAVKYKSGANKLFINGILIATDTSTLNFTTLLSDLTLNRVGAIFYGDNAKSLKNVSIFKTALTDTECINLTTL